ncbi:transcription antitermination factor NusB [Clostridium botulinum]|uniref:Transcription antitermination protein NusB n=2 Tax=Clostridium botulinum TaxID=1491 RepID=NUSB_CLOBA|nr:MULTISPECIES: transcription antitermination factor NusB [Clostridium]B2V4R8.1 RecName: Full=Transcription antitermination protein NusB; AltName: Full=Antitermination factor NusB [Clostridium botulinum E3 str. Alaska E43]ACD53940.1 transcription antitermination factor NusB [Clostridium botulinum E3 str. Alaska E43]AJF30043.1 antitermination protein NusB [Clostridium botulinum]AJF33106.1 antitermination protein NusB [Clostridium botulinum]KIL06644.1 antitermination protein NusB [Clostridium b
MNRKLSREKAMELLFGMTLNTDNCEETLGNFIDNYESDIKELDITYIKRILIGVENNKDNIDEAISKNLCNWKIDRISKVNLCILRLAVYELLHDEEIPNRVAINEALEITKKYSDEKSVSFINGVLDNILKK